MRADLRPNGNPVTVDGVTLRTPGLAGEVNSHSQSSPGLRAAERSTHELEEALSHQRVLPQVTLELTATREVPLGSEAVRSTAHGEPAIELEVPEPSPGWGQMVLYADEAGVVTWGFAPPAAQEGGIDRGSTGRRTYVLRRSVPPAVGEAAARGLIGSLGKKIIKVLAFRILDPVLGRIGEDAMERWEAERRPYRVRSFTGEDFRSPDPRPFEARDWSALSGGRTLLLVHGTFSRAHTAFGGLSPDLVRAFQRKYQGRVFALDHPTASEDPKQNVEWLLNQVPEGTVLDLDILCHSRGGLVSRILAERTAQLPLGSRRLDARKIVFVAAPNAGTVLTDEGHMGDFVDTFTTLLNLFPDNGVTEVLEGVITVAKQLACATLARLPGLQAMRPRGAFLSDLNQGESPEASYYAVASDFEPADPGLMSFFKDRLMDSVFSAGNDMVVPTSGVFESNGAGRFPIEERLVLSPSRGIHHSGYFADEAVQRQIAAWLEIER
jgi:hypothetical protein